MKSITNCVKNSDSSLSRIIKGCIISVILTLILLLIFSLILTYSNIQENTIGTIIIVITAISILIGSSIGTAKTGKNGIINGSIIGLLYIIGIYFVSSIASSSYIFGMNSVIMAICGIIAGGVGGIIGVNFK